MQVPVDIKAVIQEAFNLDEARNMPISISIYFDGTAPGDLQAHVRKAFASASTTARVSLLYLDGRPFMPYAGDDAVILVAGEDPCIGKHAADAREAGVPVCVIATSPDAVAKIAEESGYPIPAADLLSPIKLSVDPAAVAAESVSKVAQSVSSSQTTQEVVASTADAVVTTARAFAAKAAARGEQYRARSTRNIGNVVDAAKSKFGSDHDAAEAEQTDGVVEVVQEPEQAEGPLELDVKVIGAETPQSEVSEPIELDEAAAMSLSERMGVWIMDVFPKKQFAFALAFPFVRKPLSLEAMRSTAAQNAAIGAVLFIPGADMPVMTLNQAKMVLQIAAIYGEDLVAERAKEIAAVVGGGFACRSVAREIVGIVPFGGWAVKAAIGYSGTVAMGRAAIEYFEGGQSFERVSAAIAKARNKVLMMAASRAAEAIKDQGANAVGAAFSHINTPFSKQETE